MSESDESATSEAPLVKPKKRKKRKKRRPDDVGRLVETVVSPGTALARAAVDAIPQTPFFAPQRFVIAGGLATVIGLGLLGTEPSDFGRALWIGGVLTLVVGIHMLGRLGPDIGAG